MRASLTVRYLSHPIIDFGGGRTSSQLPRLGLSRTATVYHLSRGARRALPTVLSLRSQTSRFRFPSVGRPGRVRDRRAVLPLGLSRARRA